MNNFNFSLLEGNLVKDPELKTINGDRSVCNFTIGSNRSYVKKDGERVDEASFFDIVLWGRSAEAVNQYLTKGQQVGVQGELRQSRWEQDGQSRSRVEVHANNVRLLGSRGGGGQAPQSAGSESGEYSASKPPQQSNDFEDDIPF